MGGLAPKQQRSVGGYGSKKIQSGRIHKAHKTEKTSLALNIKTKKARVAHLVHDPHKQKKFLRKANLGEDIEDDVLGGAL